MFFFLHQEDSIINNCPGHRSTDDGSSPSRPVCRMVILLPLKVGVQDGVCVCGHTDVCSCTCVCVGAEFLLIPADSNILSPCVCVRIPIS